MWSERRRAPAILKLGTEPSKEAKGWFRSELEPPSIGCAVASKAMLLKTETEVKGTGRINTIHSSRYTQ